ncbi:MAG: tetratricopeptide repeat protein, partial [Phycisphaerae bacterium]
LMRLNRVQIAGRPRAEDINELTELSAQQDNRPVAARAGVMLGDAYFMHYAIGGGDEEFPIEPDEAIAQAEQAYRRVIEQYGDSPREVSRARFGLAKILETRGMFGEARQQYQAILELSGLEGDPIVELAADDLETLDDRTEPVEFAETQPTTATAPATMPAEPEVLPETPLPSDAALPGTPPLVPDGTDSDEP